MVEFSRRQVREGPVLLRNACGSLLGIHHNLVPATGLGSDGEVDWVRGRWEGAAPGLRHQHLVLSL